jgi:hypothetical protein
MWLDRRHGDAWRHVGASSHRARVADDLDHHWVRTETGKDHSVEHVTLQQGTAPTDITALVIERLRFDLVHDWPLLLASPDGAFTVNVKYDLKIAAAASPVGPDLIEHLSDRQPLLSKIDQGRHMALEVQVHGSNEVAGFKWEVHFHPCRRFLDKPFLLEHVK